MRKLFAMLVASVCCTMAFAQSGVISVKSVNISKGGTSQMEVTINNAEDNTAFQFDLELPTGVTVKSVELNGDYPATRLTFSDVVDGKLRILSYDDDNGKLDGDTKIIVTLEAVADAIIGEMAIVGSEVFLVNEGDDATIISTQDDGVVASITFTDGIKDDDTTGISHVAAEAAGNDVWHNLNGQRISAPTKKGLYIRNGKKAIVK